ncbi:MAG TPA: zinc-dependent alcohol dehydrogenase family protein [Chthoniobacterales bacterium]|jgi:D-arabinitol dehydrogenase (NADP+)|nr:zinc-dependent alcohol dehydrogenase family protein [Chthoniobacterales bacterium]
MKAIVYDAPRQFKYKEVPEPEIQSDDVLVRIDACGLCGTDLHIHEGEFAPNFPLIPGHEFTGEIVALGGSVKGLSQKQRVVGNSNESCGKCFYCMRGDFLLCLNLQAYGVTQDGGFAQYLRIKADRIFPIGNLTSREAVMVEPSACAVHGMEVLAMKPGSDVLLFGAGPTGQVLAQLLKLNGAGRLVVAAPPGPKLELAGRLAADEIVPMDRKNPDKHRNRLRELNPTGFDYIVEATGSAFVCEDALQFVRRGGTLLVYGVYPESETVRFNPFDLFRREITIKGSFAQIDAFPRALAYLESGKIKVNEIVTDEFALEDWAKVLEHAWARKGIKIAVIPPS